MNLIIYGAGSGGRQVYHNSYKGVKKAVDEFCEKNNLPCIPIGDEMSIVILRGRNP